LAKLEAVSLIAVAVGLILGETREVLEEELETGGAAGHL
jgi:hypothetical protein